MKKKAVAMTETITSSIQFFLRNADRLISLSHKMKIDVDEQDAWVTLHIEDLNKILCKADKPHAAECSVRDCGGKVATRGLCSKHYQREYWRKWRAEHGKH